jgi:biopolymer transport protein ExbD
MAMSPFSTDDDDGMMSEINMTPLVDVMLVLLIIFLVTIPAISQLQDTKPAHVDVAVEADGTVLWNDQKVDDAALTARIAQASQLSPQPELHLRADRKVPYERVADVMSAAQAGGLSKIGFVTEPRPAK